GTDVNDVGVRRGNSEAPNRGGAFLIEGGSPGVRAVGGFPNAPADAAEIVGGGIARNAGNGKRSAAAKWTDRAVSHALEQGVGRGVFLLVGGWCVGLSSDRGE